MGLFGGSKSTTNLTEENYQEINTQNLNLSDFQGVGVADAEDVDISIVSTDYEALRTAGLISEQAARSSAEVSDAALNVAGDTAGAAIRASEATTRNSLGFGLDAVDALGDVIGEALDYSYYSQSRALDTIESSNARAGEASQASLNRAFSFGDKALATTQDTLSQAFSFGEKAISSTQDTLGELTKKTVDTLSTAIGSAADATRSDSANVLNNLVKYGAIALAVAVVGTAVLRKA